MLTGCSSCDIWDDYTSQVAAQPCSSGFIRQLLFEVIYPPKTWPLTCCRCFMSIFFIPVSAFIVCHCCPPPHTHTHRGAGVSVLPRLLQCFADAACVSCRYEEQGSAQLYSAARLRSLLLRKRTSRAEVPVSIPDLPVPFWK